jgi:hypothetical protein
LTKCQYVLPPSLSLPPALFINLTPPPPPPLDPPQVIGLYKKLGFREDGVVKAPPPPPKGAAGTAAPKHPALAAYPHPQQRLAAAIAAAGRR